MVWCVLQHGLTIQPLRSKARLFCSTKAPFFFANVDLRGTWGATVGGMPESGCKGLPKQAIARQAGESCSGAGRRRQGCRKRSCGGGCLSQPCAPAAVLPVPLSLAVLAHSLPSLFFPSWVLHCGSCAACRRRFCFLFFCNTSSAWFKFNFLFSNKRFFWQCLLCPSAVSNVYFSFCTCLTKTALTQFFFE